MKIKDIKRRITKNKKGYVSIETVIGLGCFLVLFLMTIAFFVYTYPQTQLQSEVEVLATICERQGGLTEEDISNFEESLKKYSYLSKTDKPIIVTADTTTGFNAIGVTELNEDGDEYVKRNSKEIIKLTVLIPSNNELLNSITKAFGIEGINDYYYFYEPVMSERY